MVLEVKSPAMMIVRFEKERCHVVTIQENGGLPDFRFSYLSILPTSGADIGQLAGQMIRLAQVLNCPVTCYFKAVCLAIVEQILQKVRDRMLVTEQQADPNQRKLFEC
jgi:hypothetical protein